MSHVKVIDLGIISVEYMHAKYNVFISYSSKFIAKVNLFAADRLTDRQTRQKILVDALEYHSGA